MPIIRKLSEQEISERKYGKLSNRAKVAREYDALLEAFEIGDWGELQMDPTEKKLTIRNRLVAAAERKEVKLVFHRKQGPMVHFEVVDTSDPRGATISGSDDSETEGDEQVEQVAPAATLPMPEPEQPARKRPGRKPKSASIGA